MNVRHHVLQSTCAVLVLAAGCSQTARRGEDAPLFRGMGTHERRVTTSFPAAQRYFNQGLTWAYAFNHDEAIRSFSAATRHDPHCAMAWWGIALCHGPHINNPVVPPDRAAAAWAALQKAIAHQPSASPVEQALISALAARYADPQPEDRRPLDQAYADAMARVWGEFPDDPDVGTLYAEAMMDLRPWDLWTHAGEPQPGTEKILAVLEKVMSIDPQNPGANHLYVHAVEASPDPARANAAADRLRQLVPASGHLVHMPSHIDVKTGRYRLAAEQNVDAIRADGKYLDISPKQGFYRVYMVHNQHMLAFASMMEGRYAAALAAARAVVKSVPDDYLRENAVFVDPFMAVVYDTHKRFGRWDELLREPAPPSCLLVTTAMWRYSRGLAYAAKGEIALAEQEQAAFRTAVAAVPEDRVLAINPARLVLRIAEHMLNGEIALRRGETDTSVTELRKAVELEDQLLYMEPPEWMQPVRHTLGAVLLSAERYAEAEKVYREDLAEWPDNGWSLYGLSRSLAGQNKSAEAARLATEFGKSWSRADTPIASSCACVPQT